jgi:hypothetical protein
LYSVVTSLACTYCRYVATDLAGNEANCDFWVLYDTTPPSVSCVNVFMPTDPGMANATILFNNIVASDLLDPNPTWKMSPEVQVNSTWPATTSRKEVAVINVVDHVGNQGRCFVWIYIYDNQAPVLTCPDLSNGKDSWVGMEPTANYGLMPDIVDQVLMTDNVGIFYHSTTVPVGTQLLKGPHEVYFTAWDKAGSWAYCFVTINVVDLELPTTMVCPPPETKFVGDGITGPAGVWVAQWTDPVYKDNYDTITNAHLLSITYEGESFAGAKLDRWDIGQYNISYYAQDSSSNINLDCHWTIDVKDPVDPTIDGCPPPGVVLIRATDPGAAFYTPSTDVAFPLLIARDNVAVKDAIYYPSLDTPNYLGLNLVSYLVHDTSMNQALCEIWVMVLDREPPSINCTLAGPNPDDVTSTSLYFGDRVEYTVILGPTGYGNGWTPATREDNVWASVTTEVTNLETGVQLDDYTQRLNAGSYVVLFTADDLAGNGPVSCEFRLRLMDVDPPVVDCSKLQSGITDGVIGVDDGEAYWTGRFNTSLMSYDNRGFDGVLSNNGVKIELLITYPTVIDAEGYRFPLGEHTILYRGT